MMKCPLCGSENVEIKLVDSNKYILPLCGLSLGCALGILLNFIFHSFRWFLLGVLIGISIGVYACIKTPKKDRVLKCNECGNEKKVEKVN